MFLSYKYINVFHCWTKFCARAVQQKFPWWWKCPISELSSTAASRHMQLWAFAANATEDYISFLMTLFFLKLITVWFFIYSLSFETCPFPASVSPIKCLPMCPVPFYIVTPVSHTCLWVCTAVISCGLVHPSSSGTRVSMACWGRTQEKWIWWTFNVFRCLFLSPHLDDSAAARRTLECIVPLLTLTVLRSRRGSDFQSFVCNFVCFFSLERFRIFVPNILKLQAFLYSLFWGVEWAPFSLKTCIFQFWESSCNFFFDNSLLHFPRFPVSETLSHLTVASQDAPLVFPVSLSVRHCLHLHALWEISFDFPLLVHYSLFCSLITLWSLCLKAAVFSLISLKILSFPW